MRGKRWRRYESLSIGKRYTVRPHQASVTVTVPRNAFKHGRDTAEAVARRREVAALIRTMRALADATEEGE